MTFETLAPLKLKISGQKRDLAPGEVFDLPDHLGQKLLAHVPEKVRQVGPGLPETPVHVGWLVVYRDGSGRLRGGCDERDAGTVRGCTWDGSFWTVWLVNGAAMPLTRVLTVAKTDSSGRILAAWTVREYGYDGEGQR